jgi:hypothetical protein
MKAEVRQLIGKYTVDTMDPEFFEQLHMMLPADDLELDRWLAEAVENNAAWEFTSLVMVALTARRFVDARHLVQGAGMLAQYGAMMDNVRRMQGQVPEYLMEAILQNTLDPANEACALLLVAVWRRDRGNGVLPEQLLPRARSLAASPTLPEEAAFYLVGVAVTTNDAILTDLLRRAYRKVPGGDHRWDEKRKRAEYVSKNLLDPATSGLLLSETPPQEPLPIAFSRNFRRRMKKLPRHVMRQTMFALDRIAASERIQFNVYCCRNVKPIFEYRVNSEYVLLYRDLSRRVEAIDVVPHLDVERTVKSLDSKLALFRWPLDWVVGK